MVGAEKCIWHQNPSVWQLSSQECSCWFINTNRHTKINCWTKTHLLYQRAHLDKRDKWWSLMTKNKVQPTVLMCSSSLKYDSFCCMLSARSTSSLYEEKQWKRIFQRWQFQKLFTDSSHIMLYFSHIKHLTPVNVMDYIVFILWLFHCGIIGTLTGNFQSSAALLTFIEYKAFKKLPMLLKGSY